MNFKPKGPRKPKLPKSGKGKPLPKKATPKTLKTWDTQRWESDGAGTEWK